MFRGYRRDCLLVLTYERCVGGAASTKTSLLGPRKNQSMMIVSSVTFVKFHFALEF